MEQNQCRTKPVPVSGTVVGSVHRGVVVRYGMWVGSVQRRMRPVRWYKPVRIRPVSERVETQKVDLTASEANTASGNLNKYKSSLSPNCTSTAQKGKGVSFGNSAWNREDISSSTFASRFELKLEQPPYFASNSSEGAIPTSMQLTPQIDVQATHFSQPAVNKGREEAEKKAEKRWRRGGAHRALPPDFEKELRGEI